jgi:hypothetical protein
MKYVRTTLLLGLSLCAMAIAADETPLLKNGDFAGEGDKALTGWKVNGAGQTLKPDTDAKPEGAAQSLRIDIKNTAEGQGSVSQSVKPIKPKTKYVLTAKVKGTAARLGALGVKLKKDGKELTREKTDWNGTDWAELKLEFDSGDADEISVECRFAQGEKAKDQTVWFANVRLVESK